MCEYPRGDRREPGEAVAFPFNFSLFYTGVKLYRKELHLFSAVRKEDVESVTQHNANFE
jgi:hypothetical protein